jgi:hypothetical protein
MADTLHSFCHIEISGSGDLEVIKFDTVKGNLAEHVQYKYT